MAEKRPLKKRHYKLIKELASESQQDLPETGMRRRAIAMTMLQQYYPQPQNPSLVGSADGALEAMVFTVPDYVLRGDDNPLWKVFSDLFLKLPPYTELHLLTHEANRAKLEEWLQENNLLERATFHIVPKEHRMLIWAEDDYEIVQDVQDGTYYVVQPHSHRRAADDYMGYYLAQSLGLERVKVPLYFEGGNLLIGDNFFMMGTDYIVDSMLDLKGVLEGGSEGMVTEKLADLFKKNLDHGRELFMIGSRLYVPQEEDQKITVKGEEWTESFHVQNEEGTVQPLFHIDMFLTLAGRNKDGKYQVLVGDTRMAAEIVGTDLIPYCIPEVFDEVSELLRRQGFEVIRNPLPVTYIDDPKKKTRSWFYATSNNALVEVKSENEKTVWLPTYGHGDWKELKKTDEANKKIWEELGFRVVQLEDFIPFAEKSGALHCIKKYLRRGKIEK